MSQNVGDNNNLCFIPSEFKEQPYLLTDIIGIASGVKKAAFLEATGKEEVNFFLERVYELEPKRKLKVVTLPMRNWQLKYTEKKFYRNVFIGENEKHLLNLKEIFGRSEEKYSHREVGTLLSYPKCCCLKGTLPRMKNGKPFLIGTANKINFLINNFYGRTTSNIFLTRHYVCDYNCKESIIKARKIFNYLGKFENMQKSFERILKYPFLLLSPEFITETKENRRPIYGNMLVFDGKYKSSKELCYKRIYFLERDLDPPTDKDKEKDILNKVLSGDRIVIRDRGIDVYKGIIPKERLDNDDLTFVWPR